MTKLIESVRKLAFGGTARHISIVKPDDESDRRETFERPELAWLEVVYRACVEVVIAKMDIGREVTRHDDASLISMPDMSVRNISSSLNGGALQSLRFSGAATV